MLVYNVRAEARRQSITLSSLSWKCVCRAAHVFLCSVLTMNDNKSFGNIELGITNTFLQVDEFTNMEFTNNEA